MTHLISHNPWNGEVVADVAADSADAAREAVQAVAQHAQRWALRRDRNERLRALASACEVQRRRIIDLLVREAGKTQADAEAEANLLPRKIAITLEHLSTRTPGLPATLANAAAACVWRPRGVAVVLGPYNFPLHLLHGLVVPALAVGCPVVAKPSECCPALAECYASLIAEAGLSDVCRIVRGGSDVAHALINHPATATVAAVGGRAMGLALHERLRARPEVVLALELGGVNQALVRSDAAVDATLAALSDGAWRMAGQRCTATRVVHVPAADANAWLDRLCRSRRTWLPGNTPAATAGPMISAELRERFQAPFRELPSGLHLHAGSAQPLANLCQAEPLVVRCDDAQHAFLREERFGPHLIVCPYRDENDALAAMAANPFRLSCSVFTEDDHAFLRCAERLPYGIVNRNRPTAGARSDLPFGGVGLSGNGRPAALAAAAIFADETVVWG